MLVIVSDLHLTDGTTGIRIPPGAFRVFRERLEGMAYDASKRENDTYKPIKEFDLVLLGDILDMLRSTQWTKEVKGEGGYARPWSNPDDPALSWKVEKIVDGIFENNDESFKILRSLADGTAISLPPPTRNGQVDRRVSRDRRSKARIPVTVNIHYMNGNHDWFLHLTGSQYDQIRKKVINSMGLRNPPSPFPHDPDESKTIQDIFGKHNVFARHGDIFDQFNFVKEEGRDYSSLGDAMVVELFNPLPGAIQNELGNELPQAFYDDLPEMGSIRPGTMTPVFIASLMERYDIKEVQRRKINEIWKNHLEKFLKLDFLDELDKWGPDWIDVIELGLKVLGSISLDKLDDIAPWVERVIQLHAAWTGGGEFGLDKNVADEEAFKSKEAQFIVYGHTHGFKVVPLQSTNINDKPFDQMYINSGTWHPLYELGTVDPKKQSFIMHKTMSYLGFYRSDERKGRTFETWTGTLDL